MARALLWKEWRRLRGLRWACVGLAVALPVSLFLASVASSRGFGLAVFAGYSPRTLFLEVLPAALALGLWPLAAMLMTVNALTADRAEGTESFLLDRPVSRSSVWWARLLASFGSLLTVVLAGAGIVLVFAASEGGLSDLGWRGAGLAIAGASLVLAATVAALGATSLVSAPLPALLLALVLVGLPLVAGVGGAVVFPHAVWQRIPLAAVTAGAIGLCLPLASWLADTRGEPGGRGRRVRAGLVLGGGLTLAALAFVVLAPIAVRAAARAGRISVAPPPAGTSTLAFREGGGGFLIDLDGGTERGFLPPEISGAAWDPAGKRLALVDESGPLGSVGPLRVRFLDDRGREIWPASTQPEEGIVDLVWAKDRVVLLRAQINDARELRHVLVLLEPASSRQTVLLQDLPAAALHALPDGRVFVAIGERASRQPSREAILSAPWVLRPVDTERGTVGDPVFRDRGPFMFAGLSPSGRYWMRLRGEGEPAILEIESGKSLPLPIPPHTVPTWLGGEEVAWLQREAGGAWTLVRLRPGEAPRTAARGVARNARLLLSPGGSRAIVVTPEMGFLGASLVDLGGRALPPLPAVSRGRIAWAGPHTLSIGRPRHLELYDVETGRRQVVFGGD